MPARLGTDKAEHMHEMSIAESTIQIVEAELAKLGHPAVVTQINLKVGKLRAVIPESLHFCFSVLAKGTSLEGSHLHIAQMPLRLACGACGTEFDLDVPLFACAECGSSNVRVVSGEELSIDSIEIEERNG